MPADEAIIQLVQAGRGQEAFERLVPAYRRRVFGLAYSILRDRGAAEDLAQEVFVKLWQALPRYDGRAKLSTWIYAITRNAAVSALRSRRRSVSLSDAAVMEEVEGLAAEPVHDPPGDAQLRRRIEALPNISRRRQPGLDTAAARPTRPAREASRREAAWLTGEDEALDGVDDRADLVVVGVAGLDQGRRQADRLPDLGVVAQAIEQRGEVARRQRRAHRIVERTGDAPEP